VSVAAGVVAAFLLASDVPAGITSARWGVFVVGLVLMWAGIALRQWAVSLLGRFFTVDVRVQSDQRVINRGPYRYVRHPSYSGMIITFLGLALGNWSPRVLDGGWSQSDIARELRVLRQAIQKMMTMVPSS
jgi:protein-S-isoprenylcysteine O-methyltransferase